MIRGIPTVLAVIAIFALVILMNKALIHMGADPLEAYWISILVCAIGLYLGLSKKR